MSCLWPMAVCIPSGLALGHMTRRWHRDRLDARILGPLTLDGL